MVQGSVQAEELGYYNNSGTLTQFSYAREVNNVLEGVALAPPSRSRSCRIMEQLLVSRHCKRLIPKLL